ncbi:MAG: LLM class flavin-dependent oxidoreductase [Ilumatobacteraceae bacterium]
MRLGLRISGHRRTKDAVALAVAAERAGFDEVWLTEDYLERGIFTVAGAVAAATNRVRLGLGVVNPFTRHPGLIAMEAAALCELAEGRVVLALGGSNSRWINGWLGIEHVKPLGAVREANEIIRSLLGGRPTRHDGAHFSVDAHMAFSVDSVPPIWYGVKGPQGLRAAAVDADGVVLSVLSSPGYVEWVRQVVGADVELGAFVEFSLGEDPVATRHAIRPFVARFLGMHGDAEITRRGGLGVDDARAFASALASGSPDVARVTNEILDSFVVVGDIDDCARGVRRYESAGLDTFIVGDQPDRSTDGMIDDVMRCWEHAGLAVG